MADRKKLSLIERARAKFASIIAPTKQEVGHGISRFVAVRFFLPGAGATVEIYDRESASDCAAWDENQRLYPCQIVGYAARAVDLAGFHHTKGKPE